MTLVRYALTFYLGATLALVLPLASPLWVALGARLLAELNR